MNKLCLYDYHHCWEEKCAGIGCCWPVNQLDLKSSFFAWCGKSNLWIKLFVYASIDPISARRGSERHVYPVLMFIYNKFPFIGPWRSRFLLLEAGWRSPCFSVCWWDSIHNHWENDTAASQLGVCGRDCGGFPCYIVFVGFWLSEATRVWFANAAINYIHGRVIFKTVLNEYSERIQKV